MLPPAALAIIAELVDAAPPLTPAQQRTLQRIFTAPATPQAPAA